MTSCHVLITVVGTCNFSHDQLLFGYWERQHVINIPLPYTIADIIYYRTVIILISPLHIVGI